MSMLTGRKNRMMVLAARSVRETGYRAAVGVWDTGSLPPARVDR